MVFKHTLIITENGLSIHSEAVVCRITGITERKESLAEANQSVLISNYLIQTTITFSAFYPPSIFCMPVPAAAPSKAQVFGRSPAEIVGSNPTGGMDVCLL